MQNIERRLDRVEKALESKSRLHSEDPPSTEERDQKMDKYQSVFEKLANRISGSPENVARVQETLKSLEDTRR